MCHNIAGMIHINKCRDSYQVPMGFRHLCRQLLFNVTIKVCPVCIVVENILVHWWHCWVICDTSSVRMPLKICKDMVSCLNMSNPWVCLILQQQRDFNKDVNMTEFNCPSKDANHLHEVQVQVPLRHQVPVNSLWGKDSSPCSLVHILCRHH